MVLCCVEAMRSDEEIDTFLCIPWVFLCLLSDFMLMTVGGNMGRLLRGHRFYRGGLKVSSFCCSKNAWFLGIKHSCLL